MKRIMQVTADALFCYMMAWVLIALSPLWFPVWYAVKIYQKPRDWDKKAGV